MFKSCLLQMHLQVVKMLSIYHEQIYFDKEIDEFLLLEGTNGLQFTKCNCVMQCLQTCLYWQGNVVHLNTIFTH